MIDAAFVTIVVGSFVATVVNAAFSTGGALIVLAITTTVLVVQAIVPIHSTLLIGSTISRFYYFRECINWNIAGPFLVGSALGALLGSGLYVELPEVLLATAISILMSVSVMGVFKIAGYAIYGFDYSPYLLLIASAIVVSFIGTWVGKLPVDKIPEKQFRIGFRILISVIALRLLYSGLSERMS